MILSPHEIAHLALQVGFSSITIVPGAEDTELVCAVAVALAESGGNTEIMGRSASSSVPERVGQRDHGLFQISGYWHWQAIRDSEAGWRDPLSNTRLAYSIFVGGSVINGVRVRRTFAPWSVFNGTAPAYVAFLPDARLAAARPFSVR